MAETDFFRIVTCAGLGFVAIVIVGCTDPNSGNLNSGGLEPPPGFLERTDANCRSAAADDTEIGDLEPGAPSIRQLNGQSLFGYTTTDGARAQCVVRHTDESVIDVRVIVSD